MSDSRSNESMARARLRRSLTSDAASRLRAQARRSVFRVMGDDASDEESSSRTGRADYQTIKGTLQDRLLAEIGERNLFKEGETGLIKAVQEFTERVLETEAIPLNDSERSRLGEELADETVGLGPLAPLMADPAVTDILVNGPDRVYVERFGRIEKTDAQFRDVDHIVRVIERIAALTGRRIDASSPMADLRLADGSRVNATLPPASIDGPTISIRRFGRRRLRRDELLALGMMSQEMMTLLSIAVRARKNMIISGGTGAGKSTLLGALAESIPSDERIVTIEDTAELVLDQEHVVRLETRPPNIESRGEITARDLVVNTLRMRPDRIIVGEVRAGEALDMLQAMNTGHDGGLSTIHANSPRDAIARLETMVLMAGIELPSRAIREQIVAAIQLVVHVRRYDDGVRRVESIAEITGLEGNTPLLQEIFQYRRKGRLGRRVKGEFAATGIVPRFIEELREMGMDLPMNVFQQKATDAHS
jgi:pilus assembly protein CpaF